MSFDAWKKEAVEYLHSLAAQNPNSKTHGVGMWDWILGNDDDMRSDGYDEDETPQEYVDYQLECAM